MSIFIFDITLYSCLRWIAFLLNHKFGIKIPRYFFCCRRTFIWTAHSHRFLLPLEIQQTKRINWFSNLTATQDTKTGVERKNLTADYEFFHSFFDFHLRNTTKNWVTMFYSLNFLRCVVIRTEERINEKIRCVFLLHVLTRPTFWSTRIICTGW